MIYDIYVYDIHVTSNYSKFSLTYSCSWNHVFVNKMLF